MDNCFTGTSVPTQVTAPCGGEYKSTDCIQIPATLIELDVAAGSTQTEVNIAMESALVQKDAQITTLQNDVAPFAARKVFRGSFLGSNILTTAEDTIGDITITHLSTGVYEINTNSTFPMFTSVYVTPNTVAAFFEEVTINYLYANAFIGSIVFKVRNNGTLVDLLESPIKIEI